MELPTIFGPAALPFPSVDASFRTYNKPLVPVVMSYFISFVRDHNPNTYQNEGSPFWGNFGEEGKFGDDAGGEGQRLVLQTNATAMEDVPDDLVDKCKFWRSLGDLMAV